jgi:aminocarboxymuconate-semialdehyde decarboxylase
VPVIDLHAHSIVQATLQRMAEDHPNEAPKLEQENGKQVIRQAGTGSQSVPKGLFETEIRLADMDKQGVDIQVLSLPTSQLNYHLDGKVGADFARIQNDAFVATAAQHGDRIAIFGQLPLQDPEASLAEIERLKTYPAIRGINIGTNVKGANLDDPSLEPVWESLEAADLPVWVHPDHRSLGHLDRIKKYYMQNNIGNPLDTTIAIASVIHGGILERYPNLRFGFSHGGGFAPYQIRRWDFGWERHAAAREHIPNPPSAYFEKLFFDTLVQDSSLRMLTAHVGWDQIVVGSDYPMSMGSDDPIKIVRELKLPKSDERKVLSGNAERFMRKVG